MPIEYRVLPACRLVHARGFGIITDRDIFEYQREAWSRPEVRGFDELVDFTDVEEIVTPTPPGSRMQALAAESSATDPPEAPAKFAIVAGDTLAYGLGRMYQAYRELDPRSTKVVRVVRTLDEAERFLEIEDLAWDGPAATRRAPTNP
ncbi:MAG TPA: hypothetical protein VFU59_04890 [Candidatus Eisenbacteria bacterium]|nr:hypothetical protein [Candidatus Eisenbacteria bacterium]